jgi:pilus assembly protein CpaD
MTRRSPATAAAVLLLTGLLAGCATGVDQGPAPLTPISRFSLQVEPGLDRIALAVHEQGVSAAQNGALHDLVRRFAEARGEVLVVEAPAGEDPASAAMAWRVRSALEALGVPAHRIVVASYPAPDPRAPVLAGFETARVVIPDCSAQHGNMRSTFANRSSLNLGCAITANMAAQIDNPRDIIQPRGMTPSDSGRAAVVFDAYRKGDNTSTPQEELVRGRVANVVE